MKFGKQQYFRPEWSWLNFVSDDKHNMDTSDILVLKIILVLVYILFSSQNFYFI